MAYFMKNLYVKAYKHHSIAQNLHDTIQLLKKNLLMIINILQLIYLLKILNIRFFSTQFDCLTLHYLPIKH